MTQEKKLSRFEQWEEDIIKSDDDIITKMMKILEHRWYVDTDWRSECTFEEDVRPIFEKLIADTKKDRYYLVDKDWWRIFSSNSLWEVQEFKQKMIWSWKFHKSTMNSLVIIDVLSLWKHQ